jgi:hypothetical protein
MANAAIRRKLMSLGADIGRSLLLGPVGRDGVGECNHEIDRTQNEDCQPGPKFRTFRKLGHTALLSPPGEQGH